MSDYVQVLTATETREAGEELARSAVNAKLAGSAQVAGPVVSVFWHHGQQGTGQEWQVVLDTTRATYAALEAHLIKHHPWTNPQVIAVPIVAGASPYLEWLDRATANA